MAECFNTSLIYPLQVKPFRHSRLETTLTAKCLNPNVSDTSGIQATGEKNVLLASP